MTRDDPRLAEIGRDWPRLAEAHGASRACEREGGAGGVGEGRAVGGRGAGMGAAVGMAGGGMQGGGMQGGGLGGEWRTADGRRGGASWHAHGAAGRRGTASGAARGDARRAATARELSSRDYRDYPRLPETTVQPQLAKLVQPANRRGQLREPVALEAELGEPREVGEHLFTARGVKRRCAHRLGGEVGAAPPPRKSRRCSPGGAS